MGSLTCTKISASACCAHKGESETGTVTDETIFQKRFNSGMVRHIIARQCHEGGCMGMEVAGRHQGPRSSWIRSGFTHMRSATSNVLQ